MQTDNNLRNYGPYQAALKDDWEGLKSFFEPKDLDKKQGPAAAALSTPLTAAGDTAFHLAVFSQREEPLKSFLSIGQRNPMTTFDFSIKNDYGNTALHEAAANGNIEAVTLLVNHINGLSFGDEEYLSSEALEDKNNEGETPLFRAAAYGRTKVVKFLAPKSSEDGKLKDSIHRKTLIRKEPKPDASNPPVASREIKEVVNEDNSAVANQGEIIEVLDASILHIAIQGQHFETALELLKLDESLATMKDMKGRASLHLLATIPSAFKSGYRMGAWINRVFYFCLPIDDRIDEEKGSCLNLGKGLRFGDNEEDEKTSCLNLFKGWPILGKICEPVREICQEKRKHKLALRLAKSLIAKDPTWIESIAEATQASATDSDEQGKTQVRRAEKDSKSTPLLLATERGIVEIVEEILEIFPELVEDRNHLNQNILHVAIKHRQTEIFDHVKNMKIPMTRLVRVVDTDGYTILHHAAYMEHETTDIHPAGPVYELQEEINWYKVCAGVGDQSPLRVTVHLHDAHRVSLPGE
ncbi:hypothetical protein Patl1_09866 [Pistacia atlantica]|uniref:Uncharacterized protein n=1 Tax=Pistacia atlantica TaxID=434234 RepID=A0ACC1A7Q5_9ROSI|nr:hypothetical protein Patl1_09866 [Pistacia atlantica]